MTTLIKIGNSQGIRIPKALIEQARLADTELEFKVTDAGLLIRPANAPRQGWAERFAHAEEERAAHDTDQEWLDAPLTDDKDLAW
ncbi:MAG: AbrB/MazE/SpoVT family DNA-binding domain-containing protein [Deltaproteobacteria bacterium]|nr:AbrB/MazE/SpoVT family DNA-binding domain-containing protein [Deltaproteobacteria bacterium]